jgi:hypothetical protein
LLKGHEGFVKGVAWGPLGKYLASQGDDAVVIWRCEDWQQVARITEGMHGTSMNFHCRCACGRVERRLCHWRRLAGQLRGKAGGLLVQRCARS